MKLKYFPSCLMLALAVCFTNLLPAQKVFVSLKNGRSITGNLKSMSLNEVWLDPDGSVELLVLNAREISTLTFTKKNRTLTYPVSEEQIPVEYKNKKYQHATLNDQPTNKLLIGIKGGLNNSSWYGDGDGGTKSRTGFHVGAAFQFQLDNEYSFQPELEYSSEGVKSDGHDNFQIALNYLNIPLLFRRKMTPGFYYEGGFLYGVLLSARGKIGGVSVAIKDQFKKSDLAFVAGLGYQSALNFGVGVRANLGLKNVSSDPETPVSNGVLQLSAFYLFNTGSNR